MPKVPFLQIDVFTSRPFGGNQLAVFLDADSLSLAEMQTLAKEMNFAESTFVLKPELPSTDARVRIFTPTLEMPMAGHPTVGTALILRHLNRITTNQATLHLNIGPTPIEFDDTRAWMTQSNPTFSDPHSNHHEILDALGLDASDLLPRYPIQTVSTGVPYVLVPLASLEALSRTLSRPQSLAPLSPHCFYLFTSTTQGFRTRMFNPIPGESPEDPATGSAAGPLAAYAVHHGLQPDGEFLIEQGIEMGRPSQIYARAAKDATTLQIGGSGVIVGQGEIFW